MSSNFTIRHEVLKSFYSIYVLFQLLKLMEKGQLEIRVNEGLPIFLNSLIVIPSLELQAQLLNITYSKGIYK